MHQVRTGDGEVSIEVRVYLPCLKMLPQHNKRVFETDAASTSAVHREAPRLKHCSSGTCATLQQHGLNRDAWHS